MQPLDSILTALAVFAPQTGAAFAVLLVGIGLYLMVTPYHELRLVKAGNIAAAVSLAGAVLGLAIAVSSAFAASATMADILVWGTIAVCVQLLAFGVMRLVLRDLTSHIEDGDIAPAILLASAQIAAGMITGAATGA